jgi:ribosome-associated translation inhibitor RaiA
MRISIAHPGQELDKSELESIERDLDKIDRRLKGVEDVDARVRISNGQPGKGYHVVLELEYRKNHLIAKADSADVGMGVREAREEILRQIKDRSKGGHSSYSKHT